MHYVHTSSTHSTQVCLSLIRGIQGLLEERIFPVWYQKLSVLCNENCLSAWVLISRPPWQPTCTCLDRGEPEGPWTAALGGKTLHKSSIYPWWALHGSLTAGNKDTVCEGISEEMPSQPVVPGQERTAVHHTAALCNMMLKHGCIHQQSSVTRGRSCNISNRGFTHYKILPMWVTESWASAAPQKHRLAVSLIFWWRLCRFKCGDSAIEKYDGASCFMKCEPSVTSLTGLWIVKPGVWLRRPSCFFLNQKLHIWILMHNNRRTGGSVSNISFYHSFKGDHHCSASSAWLYTVSASATHLLHSITTLHHWPHINQGRPSILNRGTMFQLTLRLHSRKLKTTEWDQKLSLNQFSSVINQASWNFGLFS